MGLAENDFDLAQLPIANADNTFMEAWASGWTIPPQMDVSEWANKYRMLPKEGAAEPGRFRWERTPHVKEILDCLSSHSPVEKVVMMTSTQVGKTETGLNWMGYVIDHDPAPFMVVQPSGKVVQRYSQQRVAPMIEATPQINAKVASSRGRDGGNTTALKQFDGGVLVLASANSGNDLRSTPVKCLHLDEVDAYPEEIGADGKPCEVAERRTSTFSRRKILYTSTPLEKDCSVIEGEYLDSDQCRRWVPCIHCDEFQVLDADQITPDGQYLCEHCGDLMPHTAKAEILGRGEWRPDNPGHATRGFQISALYISLGLGYTWKYIYDKKVKAQKDDVLKKSYFNTLLGLPYESSNNRLEWKALRDRKDMYTMRTIPVGCMILTCGIDTQDDRFAITLLGWGRGERAWVIDWLEIPGDPSRTEIWKRLDEYLLTPITNRYGYEMPITCALIDSGGHHTHAVYNFCREREHRLVLAGKGASTKNRPVIASRPSKQDVNTAGGVMKDGVSLWQVGTDTAKGTLFSRMQGDAECAITDRMINFAKDLPTVFYEGVASEVYEAKLGKWVVRRNVRNEPLDCVVYGFAAACHPLVRVHVLSQSDWDRIELKVQPIQTDLFTENTLTDSPKSEAEDESDEPVVSEAVRQRLARKKKRKNPRKRNFTQDY